MKTIVVNKRHSRYDVDITRQGPYGNRWRIIEGPHGRTREEAIEKHRQDWLERLRGPEREKWTALLEHLRGKRVGCVCRPLRCHGDVYVELLETVRSEIR